MIYDNSETFWLDVSPHLKKEEAKNSLMLGLSYIFRQDSKDCVFQSAREHDRRTVAAIVCSRYRQNTNFLPSPVANLEHAKALFKEFKKRKIPVTGLIGEAKTAKHYKALFEDMGFDVKVHMSQGIYKCEKVKVPKSQDGAKFRVAGKGDIKILGKWIENFQSEAVPHDPPVKGVELAESKIGKGQIFVLEMDKKLVAMAAWGRDIETSCSINLVYTPESMRKNGYGSLVTALITKYFLERGRKETNLYTDMGNPTSNKIYQNIGYEFVCDSIHFGVTKSK